MANYDNQEVKKCSKCGMVKHVSEFYKDKFKCNGLTSQCKECIRAHYHEPEVNKFKRECEQERRQKPEIKKYRREYQRKYYQKPEVKKYCREYQRKYYQKPEVKEKHRDRGQSIEVLAYRRIYNQKKRKECDDAYIIILINSYHKININSASEKEKQVLIDTYGSIENCIEFHRKSVKLQRELKKCQQN